MDRRLFLQNAGLAFGVSALTNSCSTPETTAATPETWEGVRAQFPLSPGKIHMSQMLLATHPKHIAAEIERHRKALDADPDEYWEKNMATAENVVAEAAAKYMSCLPGEVALTDSTTMGLSTVYNGLTHYFANAEILSSTHDHYSTEKSLEFAAGRVNATIKRVALYTDPAKADAAEIADMVDKNITPKTKVLALTWVHSSTGVKLPISGISEVVKKHNASRKEDDQVIFVVDGVHGFGIDNIDIGKMGCDFFIAGTHKWLFGPRGTGIIYGKKKFWKTIRPTIPAFSMVAYGSWLGVVPANQEATFSDSLTPGGFHSFEHRWSLNVAFEWMMTLGKDKVEKRTHELSVRLKNGLKSIPHVKVHTPLSNDLSAGINCFDVDGMKPEDVMKKLVDEHHILASTAPYKVTCVRLTPSIVNSEEEVDKCIKAIEGIKA
ncbi:MAG TPA: aminotransferase class V-fold PLP-dependent enzyme [Cyclobacteriaceae bacterium]|nr:aminotransferase class V-fold PLP-dependent enzyme [Cyclobacteriaceae bacterium]